MIDMIYIYMYVYERENYNFLALIDLKGFLNASFKTICDTLQPEQQTTSTEVYTQNARYFLLSQMFKRYQEVFSKQHPQN